MKKLGAIIFAAFLAVVAIAQTPPPSYNAGRAAIVTAATTTGAKTAVRGLNVEKTYEVVGSTGSGTGTAVVSVEGSNGATSWSNIGTVTLSLTTTPSSGSFTSQDRYTWLRGNVSTLTGTTATVSITAGY